MIDDRLVCGQGKLQLWTKKDAVDVNGELTGMTLEVVNPRLIIQSWRSTEFNTDDPDSISILYFTAEDDQGRFDLIHLDVPSQNYDAVIQGREKFYWAPWREYLGKNEG